MFSNDLVEIEGGAGVNGSIYVCGGDVYVSGDSELGTELNPIEIRPTGALHWKETNNNINPENPVGNLSLEPN